MLQSTKLLKGKVSVGISVKRGSGVVLKFTSSWLLGLQAKSDASTRKKIGISEKYFLRAILACRFEEEIYIQNRIFDLLYEFFPSKNLPFENDPAGISIAAFVGHFPLCSGAAVTRSAGQPSVFPWAQG
jgi:hypothetical protein